MPIKVQSSTAWKEIPISLFVAVVLLFLVNDFKFSQPSYLSRVDSYIMLTMFILFLYYVFIQMKEKNLTDGRLEFFSDFILFIQYI